MKLQYPAQAAEVYANQQQLKSLQDRNAEMARLLFSKKYF
jgi:hypothetical protein